MTDLVDPVAAFLDACFWHGSLDKANALLAAHPEVATASIHTAAMLGDDETVRSCLRRDPASATAKGGPRGVDALTHLCFSAYLRLDASRSDGFVRTAKALLDAGASAHSGFADVEHRPKPEWESVLYGAAGVAHHAEITRLLLEHGADPNDEETPYHAPETFDNAAVRVLVESGRLTEDSLAVMLVRKADWHDGEGIQYLLEHGADPNRMTRWKFSPLHQALRRDNALENIAAMLDHGGDPTLTDRSERRSGVALAARGGRSDVLELFEHRGISIELDGVDGLIAACAMDDTTAVHAMADREPGLVRDLVAESGKLLASFALTENPAGVRQLLDLGVGVGTVYQEGDGYWGIAPGSTALHVAALLLRPIVVELLLTRGAAVDARDGKGRTPLALAVRACVDSYWTERRSPRLVRMLLDAGASVEGVAFPSGDAEIDRLLSGGRGRL